MTKREFKAAWRHVRMLAWERGWCYGNGMFPQDRDYNIKVYGCLFERWYYNATVYLPAKERYKIIEDGHATGSPVARVSKMLHKACGSIRPELKDLDSLEILKHV